MEVFQILFADLKQSSVLKQLEIKGGYFTQYRQRSHVRNLWRLDLFFLLQNTIPFDVFLKPNQVPRNFH